MTQLNEKFLKFKNYAELRDYGLKCKAGFDLWSEYLSLKQKRDAAIAEVINQTRKKRPGLSNYEIIKMYSDYLQKNFPVPIW